MNLFKNNILTITGFFIGGAAGFAYYYYVGCLSGTCAITSRPVNSILYGALMGGLLFSTFRKEEHTNKK